MRYSQKNERGTCYARNQVGVRTFSRFWPSHGRSPITAIGDFSGPRPRPHHTSDLPFPSPGSVVYALRCEFATTGALLRSRRPAASGRHARFRAFLAVRDRKVAERAGRCASEVHRRSALDARDLWGSRRVGRRVGGGAGGLEKFPRATLLRAHFGAARHWPRRSCSCSATRPQQDKSTQHLVQEGGKGRPIWL